MVTVQQLAQLRYLKQEINVERERLIQLRARAEYSARRLDGMPSGGSRYTDRTGLYAAELAYLEQLLSDHMHRAVCELLRLQSFINDIPDSELRLIFYYRYIKGLSWNSIAFRIGRHDEQIPRKKHDRYLKEIAQREQAERAENQSENRVSGQTKRMSYPAASAPEARGAASV